MGGKAALIHIIGFGFILGYISTNLSEIAGRSQGNMSTYAAATESHNLAITAANVGLAHLYQDTSWRGTVTQTLSGELEGQFTYSVTTLPDGRPVLRAISNYTSGVGLIQDTVEISFGGLLHQSFSLFAWMSDFEGNVFWFTGDTIYGRVHSNGNLHMTGSPVFMEKVTTAKRLDPKWGRGGNQAVFKHGFETGVAEIDFPTDLAPLFTAAAAGGRRYTVDITVDLYGGTSANDDGYALVSSGGTVIDSIGLADPAFNGAIAGTGRVSVKGIVDGRVSIGSSTDIYVLDDLHYENRDVSSSDDILGLVAERNVVVADNIPNRTHCEIDGSIFARTNSFMAENYNTGSPRGQLRVHGSIVQRRRGAVGTFHTGSTSVKTGYSKLYRYDERLEDPNFRPPYYPGFYRRTYAISSWWESVHVPEFN